MPEKLIVGAGLSGLVAAINLARAGYKVRILEKYTTVGGQPERWPAVDVTPMRPAILGEYIGIPLGDPQVKPCRSLDGYFWGRHYDVPLGGSDLVCVERGPRKTALDGYLLEIAKVSGVEVEFGSPVFGQGEFARLPADTIVATGLYADTYDSLGIPYQMGWCFGAKWRSERDAEAAIYFNDYTTDYAYWGAQNGISMVLFFKRGPIDLEDFRAFERELEATESLVADEWLSGYGPTPTVKFSNPRLFTSDKILAGTISGMMDPFALFGVHGALVSGKIAALAVEDRNAAWTEYRRMLCSWRRMLLNRKVYDRIGNRGRQVAVMGLNEWLKLLGVERGGRFLRGMFRAVPGYARLK